MLRVIGHNPVKEPSGIARITFKVVAPVIRRKSLVNLGDLFGRIVFTGGRGECDGLDVGRRGAGGRGGIMGSHLRELEGAGEDA